MESKNIVIVFLWIFVIIFLVLGLWTDEIGDGFSILFMFFIALIFSIVLAFAGSEEESEEVELSEQIQNLEKKIDNINKKIEDIKNTD